LIAALSFAWRWKLQIKTLLSRSERRLSESLIERPQHQSGVTEIMLRNNRKFQFAVGVTAIVIVIRWLLTGDLLMAVEAARPPAEGETKSLTVLSVVGPMLIEACVIIGASIIAWALKLWDFVAAVVDRSPAPTPPPVAHGHLVARPNETPTTTWDVPAASAITADAARGVPAANPRQLVDALAKAVAAGDAEAESTLRKEIRKPYLQVELGKCVKTANWERARGILDELESMDGVKPAATSKKRTNSAQSSAT
jgi:hypothetical protein